MCKVPLHPDSGMGVGARPAGGDVRGRGDPDRRALRICISQRESLAKLVLAVAGMIMTIPSIALSGITIPMFSVINREPALSRPSRRWSIFPVAHHPGRACGREKRAPRYPGCGDRMGMTPVQRLRRVEIPIAFP